MMVVHMATSQTSLLPQVANGSRSRSDASDSFEILTETISNKKSWFVEKWTTGWVWEGNSPFTTALKTAVWAPTKFISQAVLTVTLVMPAIQLWIWAVESREPKDPKDLDSDAKGTDPQAIRSVAFATPSQALVQDPNLNDNLFRGGTSKCLMGLFNEAGYKSGRSLGNGNFGSVSLYTNEKGEGFAVKRLSEQKVMGDQKWFKANVGQNGMVARGEALALELQGHSNVLRTYGLILYNEDTREYRVVTNAEEFKPESEGHEVVAATLTQAISGSEELFDAIPAYGFQMDDVRKIGRQVAEGIRDIHKKGFIHRDIKPENILYHAQTGQAYLIDFGFLRNLKEAKDGRTTTICGSPCYVAPEVLRGGGYTEKVDAWSFGTTLFTMMYGDNLFQGDNQDQIFRCIRCFENSGQSFSDYFVHRVSSSNPDEVKFLNLLDKLIAPEGKRLTAEEALVHPFFQQEQ